MQGFDQRQSQLVAMVGFDAVIMYLLPVIVSELLASSKKYPFEKSLYKIICMANFKLLIVAK